MFPDLLRKPPVLGVVILALMMCEKMLAHTYTGIIIYGLPAPWTFWIPLVVGTCGIWLVIRGLRHGEITGSLYGYLGSMLIWMSWFEPLLPQIAQYDEIGMFLPEHGNKMAGLLGEHVLLQSTAPFCFMLVFYMIINKDVRCRMMLWLRRRMGLMDTVGRPVAGNKLKAARVAALEYFAVTWFMYVVTLILIDPRLLGLYHPVTYTISALVVLWGLYLVYKLTEQRQIGYAIRYGIGATGVIWFIPEVAALYEKFDEFYLRADQHPIAMSAVFILFVYVIVLIRRSDTESPSGGPDGVLTAESASS